jgi:spermidine synthase
VKRSLILLYFFSGLGALVVETVWMRWLREVLGATAPAASATLVAFFAGHAIGAAWSARRPHGGARALVLYGRLEIAAAMAACVVPFVLLLAEWTLSLVYDRVRDLPGTLALVRFAVALVATLPAAFCFGATFPQIAAATADDASQLGARGGALYAANAFGAALGTALASFWLPGFIGVYGTYFFAIWLLGHVGVNAIWIAQRAKRRADESQPAPAIVEPDPQPKLAATPKSRAQIKREKKQAQKRASMPAPEPRALLRLQARELGRRGLVALAAFSGFGAFALQVLLVQSFAQVLNQSIYAFGAVVVVVLLVMAAAGALVAALQRNAWLDARTLLGLALVAASLALAAFPAWLARATNDFEYVGSSGGGIAYLAAALGTVVATAGPVLFTAALVFPATFAAAGRNVSDAAGAVLGRLLVANTIGAIAGAIAAPYLLMPAFGLWPAFAALAVGYGAAAIFVPEANLRWRMRRDLILAVGWMIVLFRASPLAVPPFHLAPGENAIDVETTPAAIVAVVEKDGERLIRIDNHYALGGTAEQVHQERQAHLPLVLAPHAKRVAYVGSATGISAGGALAHPIESLHLVEIVPGVARAAERYFGDANRRVYRDPRTKVVLDDARNFLRSTNERFDVVIADLFVPWQAGTGSLYTLEHFEAVRDHLEPDGLFCQWLPLYQLSEEELRVIAATFLDVFPNAALFRGDFYGSYPIAALIGFTGEAPNPEAIAQAARRLAAAGVEDRWVTDPAGVWSLYVAPLAPFAGEASRNSDGWPVIEEMAAATHAGGNRGKLDPVVGAKWIGVTDAVRAAAKGKDRLFALDAESLRAVEGGAALQMAGALYVGGQQEAAARAFTKAGELLPRRLVIGAEADGTAAELWSGE